MVENEEKRMGNHLTSQGPDGKKGVIIGKKYNFS
jgi:hypothetical protein